MNSLFSVHWKGHIIFFFFFTSFSGSGHYNRTMKFTIRGDTCVQTQWTACQRKNPYAFRIHRNHALLLWDLFNRWRRSFMRQFIITFFLLYIIVLSIFVVVAWLIVTNHDFDSYFIVHIRSIEMSFRNLCHAKTCCINRLLTQICLVTLWPSCVVRWWWWP